MRREIPPRVASTHNAVGWFLEIHDLALSKCAAGRDRDWEYTEEAIRAGPVDPTLLLALSAELPLTKEMPAHIERMLLAIIHKQR